MEKERNKSQHLAEAITKTASKQTYYTIRFLADRDLRADAYRAYAYFRWVDDVLDAGEGSITEKTAFLNRQKSLLEACYQGAIADDLCAEEEILFELVRNDREVNNGLQTYLRSMMGVMTFDIGRRGHIVTQAALSEYSHLLATAVTEAIYYFIGHGDAVPPPETRYLAVTAAHIAHMLRDAYEDTEAGYYNIPSEFLQKHGITVRELDSPAYRQWVCGRVRLACRYFTESRQSHTHLKNLRRRIASYAYTARFEWMLRTIEREHYCLRCDYPDRKSLRACLWIAGSVLRSVFLFPWQKTGFRTQMAKDLRVKES